MIQKLLIVSGIIMSVACTIIHQFPNLIHTDNPNYNFAYEVNHPPTGDIKQAQESRRGDTVIGQYSLVQPDGVRRIVDYTADDARGFRTTVINRPVNDRNDDNRQNGRERDNEINDNRTHNPQAQSSEQGGQQAPRPNQSRWPYSQNQWPNNIQSQWPSSTSRDIPNVPSVAVSRISFVQTINSHPIPQTTNNLGNRQY